MAADDEHPSRPGAGEERTGRWSVALPRRHWFPACRSDDLGGTKPHAIDFMDQPLVVFRDGAGQPRAMVDRCPHRNVPLSLGRVADGCLQCAYHGWRFDGSGQCVEVPGLLTGDAAAATNRSVATHATTEQDGFVWFWGRPGEEPDGAPFPLPGPTGRKAGQVVLRYDLDCTLHAALENHLDVPHTAFLHKGLWRGGKPVEITAVRRTVPGGVEAEYVGEPVGFSGFRRGGDSLVFEHWDRFFLPGIAQIEYRVGEWLHITNTILHLPLGPTRTRAWFVVRYRTPVPSLLAKPVVVGRGIQIARQDVKVLAEQTRSILRFGGERYTSTDLDVLGNAIWHLLRSAEKAEREPAGLSIVEENPADLLDRTVTFEI